MANIDFRCRADHTPDPTHKGGPTITLNEGLWAYCARGADENHEWERVPTTTLADLQMASHHMNVTPEQQPEPVTASTRKSS